MTVPVESYRDTIEAGLGQLFEPRATACPMCEGSTLVREQTLRDLIQFKPGYFHMSRCASCGHIFQNPRLNERGLEFYYRDFYTGAGEAVVQSYLAKMTTLYRARALMLKGHHQPQRWLDVGGGYGHFCRTAREIWKQTEFHVVDLSATIQRAEENGWVNRAYAGRFVDLASELEQTYDVVSMFHYLEHTSDPLAELRAAASVVEPEGLLIIEVPDPDCIGRKVMGRYWPSWFAPQHLHLFKSQNMAKYLRDAGFAPILWHHAKAHQSHDAAFAIENYLRQFVPDHNLPWNISGEQASITRRASINLMWLPLKLSMNALDYLLAPLRYLPRWPNTYRVLARKRAGSAQ